MARQRRRTNRPSRGSGGRGQGEGRGTAGAWVGMVVGLALAGGGGVAFGHALARGVALSWWVGGLMELTGVLLILYGVRARGPKGGEESEERAEAVPVGVREEREPLVPLLGALLVYKYRAITREQLNRALEEQLNEEWGKRRLGDILLEMGAVTEGQLDEALRRQRLFMPGGSEPAAGEEPAEVEQG